MYQFHKKNLGSLALLAGLRVRVSSGLSLLHNGEMTVIEALYHSTTIQFTSNFHLFLYGFMVGSQGTFYQDWVISLA